MLIKPSLEQHQLSLSAHLQPPPQPLALGCPGAGEEAGPVWGRSSGRAGVLHTDRHRHPASGVREAWPAGAGAKKKPAGKSAALGERAGKKECLACRPRWRQVVDSSWLGDFQIRPQEEKRSTSATCLRGRRKLPMT